MAITKETKIVKTEIIGDYKAIQIAEDIINTVWTDEVKSSWETFLKESA